VIYTTVALDRRIFTILYQSWYSGLLTCVYTQRRRLAQQPALPKGSVTMTTEVGTNGATTLSRMNLSGYVGHVTMFSSMFTIACCLVVGLGLGLGLGLDLVSRW